MTLRSYELGLLLCGALAAGCASVTFKPGASADTAAADERACRAASADDAAFAACMRERGYYVGGRDGAKPASKPQSTLPRQHAPAAAAEAAAPVAAAPAPPVEAAVVTDAVEEAAEPAAADPIPEDPLEQVSVASWWKVGGNPAGLEGDIDRCVAQLGDAHRPNPSAMVVTVGLRRCLRTAGWFALGTVASQ